MTTVKNRVTTRRRITTAVAVTVGLCALPAAAATAAPSEAAASDPTASDQETAASWKYKDWYYFHADCEDYGEFYVDSPYFDYDDYRCERAGTWPTDYYNLYLK